MKKYFSRDFFYFWSLKLCNMTLQDLFKLIGENPSYVLMYFSLIPIAALVAGVLGKGEGSISPWREFYSLLIYLVGIPGIFSVALGVYYFLFERHPILDTNVLTQVLPVCSMTATLLLIKRNVSFDEIPGFGKISGLISMTVATFAFMWFIDRTHIVAITFIPFWQVIVIFIILYLIIRWGWSRFIS